jgi:hypothetical protein
MTSVGICNAVLTDIAWGRVAGVAGCGAGSPRLSRIFSERTKGHHSAPRILPVKTIACVESARNGELEQRATRKLEGRSLCNTSHLMRV